MSGQRNDMVFVEDGGRRRIKGELLKTRKSGDKRSGTEIAMLRFIEQVESARVELRQRKSRSAA